MEAEHINELGNACSDDIGDLYVTNCSLPRAILGFDIIIWFRNLFSMNDFRLLLLVSLGITLLALRSSMFVAHNQNARNDVEEMPVPQGTKTGMMGPTAPI